MSKTQSASDDRRYYAGLAIRLPVDAATFEIGDSGFTNWAAQVTGNATERCLVSCIVSERRVDPAEQP